MRSFLLRLTLIILTFVTALSCTRRPLEEQWEKGNYAEILLLTNWELLKEEVPTGMTAMFYPIDGSTPTVIMTNQIQRNIVRLNKGKYHVLIFNQSVYEFGSMNFSYMEHFETACAALNQLSPNSTLTADDYRWLQTMLHDPDSLKHAVRQPEPFNADRFEYEVTDDMCRRQYYKDQGILTKTPFPEFPTLDAYVDTINSTPPPVPPTLHVKAHIKGIQNAYQVKGYITNMAHANLFGLHTNTEETAIHVLGTWQITKDGPESTTGVITSNVRCFGVPTMKVTGDLYFDFGKRSATRGLVPHDYGDNILVLDFHLRDNTHRAHSFVVTHDLTYDEEVLRLDVELGIDEQGKDIILPDVPDIIGDGGAGFDATVEDWKHEDHTVSF